MKITIESTSKVVELVIELRDGNATVVPARIWEGHTDSGIPVHCYITRVGVDRSEDAAQFDRELTEQRAPSPAIAEFPLRLIL